MLSNGKKWGGELTIRRVAELKEDLLQGLTHSDRLQVDISEATDIDASCLQLLCAGHRTAVALGKQMTLTGTENLMPVLQDAGFVRHIGCALDCNQSCIWALSRRNDRETI